MYHQASHHSNYGSIEISYVEQPTESRDVFVLLHVKKFEKKQKVSTCVSLRMARRLTRVETFRRCRCI